MELMDTGMYIEEKDLFDYAASEARLLKPDGECTGRALAAQTRRSYMSIRRFHSALERRYGAVASPPPACEWLLDNWYMIQREYLGACGQLTEVRRLRCGEGKSLLSQLCRALVSSGQGQVTEKRCLVFLDGFQSVWVLSRSELLAFPAALRGALIDAVAEVCSKMSRAADTAPHAAALEALFGSLRLLSVLDADALINSADITGAVLAADPTGDYAGMDSGTKQDYLRRVELLARREGVEEHVYARRLIKKAKAENRHVGFYLFSSPRRSGAGLYIGANILITLFFTLLPAFLLKSPAAGLLLLLPMSELVKSLIDFVLLRTTTPVRLPRMDLRGGIPDSGRTICVVSAILDGSDPTQRLEELYYACRSQGRNLLFGLLGDLPVADSAETAEDAKLLRTAECAVKTLNRRHGGGFYLFTRERSFDGRSWYAKERKRGAILELARLLCGEESTLAVTGDRRSLVGVRFILTLDSDTRMYPGAAVELIGAMLHPLNAPRLNEKRRIVSSGHGVIHPRMDTNLESANATDFALIFAGAGGCDPYGSLCGELYMNAFGSGGFAGKGIVDANALLVCTGERFPEGRILSHDALEGAFLRGAYMGDVEFSDSFPARPLSYFRREHRWVRGDWQNTPWIFALGISDIDRWRLMDSLRRSLVPPVTLFAIALGFFSSGSALTVAAWAALSALLSRLFLSLAQSGLERREKVRMRRYTRLLTGVGGAIVQTFIRLWLLPYEAWVCLSAAATALWRMLVSHRDLLQWQTAAQSDRAGDGALGHIRAMWLPVVLGLALLWLSPAVIGRSAGLMWLLSPLVCSALALPAHRENSLSQADRRYLLAAAADSWRYLKDFSVAGDNLLPPDNFQEQPPTGTAHRTSPTNLGLAVAAAVAVCDTGVISREEAVSYITGIIDSMERMPRCMGHFYNWYDTRTLRPLSPAYISTVDSGNLYAGLLTVAAAAKDWGEDLLAARVDRLMADMDFSPLFDSGRGLFYICYDAAGQRGAGGWYDLMASEAMLTSFIAVAKGDVPVKHWRRLSRAQLQQDGYRGLASWTGTMFEYLMPELFLPLYHGSLLYESCRFCLYAQRRRVFSGMPWGVSESAFYSLDASLSYRYKAHGCAALALKRGQDADLVVSPYSSFLALSVEPQRAVQNLRRLENYGAMGRYGYIEALDFTPGRCRSSEGEPVRCYMAHHQAMSVIAAANAVSGGCIQRRFMSDPAMAACTLLLQERLPVDGVVIRRALMQTPEKAERSLSDRWRLRGGSQDRDEKCCVLSNGAYTLTVSSSGVTGASCGGVLIYEREHPPRLRAVSGAQSVTLPCLASESWELSEDACRFRVVDGELDMLSCVYCSGGDCGELRSAELSGSGEAAVEFRFVPVLADAADYRSHRAYWSLGIHAETEGAALLLRRLRRGSRREQWLCLMCNRPVSYTADREGALGYLGAPLVTARVELKLEAGRSESVRFALCIAGERDEAVAGAERILASGGASYGGMVGAASMRLGMGEVEVGAAMALLPALLSPQLREAAPKRDLWQYSLSGDDPIICCGGRAQESIAVLKAFCLLRSCGVAAELVYLTDEQGEYQRPLFRRISAELARVGLEGLLGQRGGVHFAPENAESVIASRAAVFIGREKPALPSLPLPRLSGARAPRSVPAYGWEEDRFYFDVTDSLPSRIWQHMLTNGSFGYIAADSGCGTMFWKNAREMAVNKPPESIFDVGGTEALWLSTGGRDYSLFAANDGCPCRVSYGAGYAVWEKELKGMSVRTTVFIPTETDARLLIIEGAQGAELNWSLRTVLGSGDGASVRCSADGGVFSCTSPEAFFPDAAFHACASVSAELNCSYAQAGMQMKMSADSVTVLACGCCELAALRELCNEQEARSRLGGVKKYWSELLGRLKIRTGVAALDRYMNSWCGYQAVACRLMGRSSLYQSGGALGFRDQLQDAVNLLLINRSFARVRILDCCRHQYEQGDVMHWWHPHTDGDRGVRTRCSDDLLWLVWGLCEYVEATGDAGICSVQIEYITSPELSDSERDRYETPEPSPRRDSVLDHARAALRQAQERGVGPHGLPFFGTGDWNDALDSVDGESVWLGFFMSSCFTRFAALLDSLGEDGSAHYRDFGQALGRAANNAWNGRWFLRGYLADGTPLGGETRIDSLCQSWSAFCPEVSPQRAALAVKTALDALTDRQNSLIKIFSPPISPDEPYLGYISSYGEGMRENGGQYTHAAVWLAMAALKTGLYDRGWETLLLLLPEERDMSRYGAEPFVLAADISAAEGRQGRAGWSWYTGSAGWYFRAVTEELLGLRLRGGQLRVGGGCPEFPEHYTVEYTESDGTARRIELQGGTPVSDSEKNAGQEP